MPNWDVGNVNAGLTPIVSGGGHGATVPGTGSRSKLNDSVFHTILSTVLGSDGGRGKAAGAAGGDSKLPSRHDRAAEKTSDTIVEQGAADPQDGTAGAAVQALPVATESVDKPTDDILSEGVGTAMPTDVAGDEARALFDVGQWLHVSGRTGTNISDGALIGYFGALPGVGETNGMPGAAANGMAAEGALPVTGAGGAASSESEAAPATGGEFRFSAVYGMTSADGNGVLMHSVNVAPAAAQGAAQLTGEVGGLSAPNAVIGDGVTSETLADAAVRQSRAKVAAEAGTPTAAAGGEEVGESSSLRTRLGMTVSVEAGSPFVEEGDASTTARRGAHMAAHGMNISANTNAAAASAEARLVRPDIVEQGERVSAGGDEAVESALGASRWTNHDIDSSRRGVDAAASSAQRASVVAGGEETNAYAFSQSANDGAQGGTAHFAGGAASTFGAAGANGATSFASSLATSDGLGESVMSQLRAPMEDIVAEMVRTPARDGVEQVSIRLRPEFLGEVVMRIAVDADGVVTARFIAEHAYVRNMIEQQLPELRAALSQHGLQLGDASVAGGEAGLAWDNGPVPDDTPQPVGTAATYGPDIDVEDDNDTVADLEPTTGGIDIRV